MDNFTPEYDGDTPNATWVREKFREKYPTEALMTDVAVLEALDKEEARA